MTKLTEIRMYLYDEVNRLQAIEDKVNETLSSFEKGRLELAKQIFNKTMEKTNETLGN